MTVKRRAPGQRRRRSRREDELRQVEDRDPEKGAELRALRQVNPQAFRKELARMIARGRIARGRSYLVNAADLELLEQGLAGIQGAVDERVEAGEFGFREVGGLLQEEQGGRARPPVLRWLQALLDGLLEAEGRDLP